MASLFSGKTQCGLEVVQFISLYVPGLSSVASIRISAFHGVIGAWTGGHTGRKCHPIAITAITTKRTMLVSCGGDHHHLHHYHHVASPCWAFVQKKNHHI